MLGFAAWKAGAGPLNLPYGTLTSAAGLRQRGAHSGHEFCRQTRGPQNPHCQEQARLFIPSSPLRYIVSAVLRSTMFGRAALYSAFMLPYWTCQLQAGRGHGPSYWLVAGNPSLPARQFSRASEHQWF
jgi:hypothetical protein